MKEKLVAKVDAHIAMLLDKPELTNEEYHIINERLREIRWAEEKAAQDIAFEERMKNIITMAGYASGGGTRVQ